MKFKDIIIEKSQESIIQVMAIVGLTLLTSCLIIMVSGENPLYVCYVLIQGAFGDFGSFVATLLQTTPILIAGLAACVGFKSGVFNIGVEGQFYVGGLAAAVIGFSWNLPPVIHVFVALFGAILAGFLWVLIPAFFRAFYGVNEVVPTILSNYIAVLLTSYFTIEVFKLPGGWAETPSIMKTAELPRFFDFSRLNLGIVIGISLCICFYLFLKYTSYGYKMRAVGENPLFALYGGIHSRSIIFIGMLSSGVIAGLGGGMETLGVHLRFMEGFAPGFGLDGVTAALASGAHPIGMMAMALFFGALRSGSLLMEVETSMSREIVTVIQSIIIIFVTIKISLKKNRS